MTPLFGTSGPIQGRLGPKMGQKRSAGPNCPPTSYAKPVTALLKSWVKRKITGTWLA